MRAILAVVTALTLISADDAFAKAKDKKAEAAAAPVITEPLAAALPTYAQFQTDIALVNGGSIQEPKDIERALDKAAALNRDAMTKGIMAYGAMTAARNQTFVAEVRKIASFYGRDKAIMGFLNDAKYAPSLGGGSAALASTARFAAADSARIMAAGENVKQRAREAQGLSWGKAVAGAAAPRTTRLKALAAATAAPTLAPEMMAKLKMTVGGGDPSLDPTSFGGDTFWHSLSAPPALQALGGPTPSVGTLGGALPTSNASLVSMAAPAMSYTNNSGGAGIRAKMVTLAALYALDATEERASDVSALLNDNITNGCLQGAQLQFYQCVASAKFNYENMACIGEAGLITVGSCVKDISR